MLFPHEATDEVQSNASGSSVTQFPEAWEDGGIIVPYLDAKVTPPQTLEFAVPMEPVAVQVNGLSGRSRPFSNVPTTPVFGVGTRRPSFTMEFGENSENGELQLGRTNDKLVESKVQEAIKLPSHTTTINSSRQRAGLNLDSLEPPVMPTKVVNHTTSQWNPTFLLHCLSRTDRTTLCWSLNAWHSSVAIQKLHRNGLESAELLQQQQAHLRQMAVQQQKIQEELAKVSKALISSETSRQELHAEFHDERHFELERMRATPDLQEEMMLEVSLLREELEMTKISEMENSEAECAILRSLRSEVMLQRQEDLAESRHALQSEEEICQDLRKELHLATSSTSSRTNFQNIPTPKSTVRNSRFSQRHAPKPSTLRSILASHPEPEVAEASVDLLAELQAAESRSHTLADEMHVQDIMLRRLRLDEQHEQQIHREEQHRCVELRNAELEAERRWASAEDTASCLAREQQESKRRVESWAARMADRLHKQHVIQLLAISVRAWQDVLHQRLEVAVKQAEVNESAVRAPVARATGAAAEALRRAEARCEISRFKSQALEAELEAALQQQLSGRASDLDLTPSQSERTQSDQELVQNYQNLRLRQLSRWAFDGLFFLMRSSFRAWHFQRCQRQRLLKAWNSNCILLSSSLSTLCSRALFAVWHQTTLASKGRLQFHSTRPLRPGILRGANRRTQGALQLLGRVWLLRFAMTLWSAAVLVEVVPSELSEGVIHAG